MKKIKCLSLFLMVLMLASLSNNNVVFADDCIHKYVEEFTTPTCTGEGHYRYYCSECSLVFEDEEIPKLNHSFGEWEVEKKQTCGRNGVKKRFCKYCNASESEIIRATGEHKFSNFYIRSATEKSDGFVNRSCAYCGKPAPTEIISRIKVIELSKESYNYDSKSHKPAVKVTDSNSDIIDKRYYTATYDKNTSSIGVHKVKVKFRNRYEGCFVLTYKIHPKPTSIKKLSPSKRSVKLTYKKIKDKTDGYQISYSTNKSFTNSKTVLIKGKNKTSKTIKNLKKNKKYYFRVRTYKIVGGKKMYSKWSDIKSVKTKK